MSVGVLLLIGFGIVLLYLFGTAFETPMKVMFKLIVSGALGGLALVVLNFIGSIINFSVALNPLSALTVGFLGIPGVMLLIVLKLIIV
ncbi:MAG: pro-sigmaK processing inhibitor BofA family protein [Carboxydocellales bacterium]